MSRATFAELDFAALEFDAPVSGAGEGTTSDPSAADAAWRRRVAEAAGVPAGENGGDPLLARGMRWRSPERIDVAPAYTAADLEDVEHLDGRFVGTFPGLVPYLRGPYSTMYVRRPWTVRQYAGFS
ncbi:MAG: methylmalonyl-CoA mutase family protein, partial [Holophagales bacterium]|nr:methylmalonyl-CoA mutase family protein [Holophagales bacterium]